MNGRVADFLETYRAAFERREVAAIADLFAYPCHVTGDGDEVDLAVAVTRTEWVDQVERLADAYRQLRVDSVAIVDAASSQFSPRVARANVTWQLLHASGSTIYEFHALYTLIDCGDRLKIATIVHDETPRLRAAMSSRSPAD